MPRTRQSRPATKRAKQPHSKSEPRLSPRKAPEGMRPDDWQRALRRQFGREQTFELRSVEGETPCSAFRVRNPQSGGTYLVRIRGLAPGDNQCACPDFRTNDLGTCKHIEFVLARLERRRGAKAVLTRGLHPPYSELLLQPGNPRTLRLYPGSGAPPAVRKMAQQLFRVEPAQGTQRLVLDAQHAGRVEEFAALCRKRGHELRIDTAARDHLAGLRDAAQRRRVLAKAFPQGAASAALAKLVKVPLYPYQAEGALFAVAAGRALIGDDMGLGKTVQAIAAAEILARHFGVRRVLVICPTSLKYQWQREIARFAGREARVGVDARRGARSSRPMISARSPTTRSCAPTWT